MVDYTIRFFGWAKDEAANSDKIWGYVEMDGKLYNFWGRRGDIEKAKSVKFKRHQGTWGSYDLQALANKKQNPGRGKVPYVSIPVTRTGDTHPVIDTIYPEFTRHFLKQLVYARLSGTVKGEEV